MSEEQNGAYLLRRFRRWRAERGIFTGRWTASDVQRHREAARQRAEALRPFIEEPKGDSA